MDEATMTIDGERVAGDGAFGVINPATGETFADAPSCSQAQLDRAMASSAKAFLSWRADEGPRRVALGKAGEALSAAAPDLAPLLTAEQGKPLADATDEIAAAGLWLTYYADLDLPREVLQDDETSLVEVVRRPFGVVAAITPWNFPLILAMWKIAPALAAGNTMVLKPSPYTPLSTLKMVEILDEVLPPGVLNCVSGGSDLGGWMTEHPTPRKISFTGSVATGKKVAAAASPDLKRVTLELGGNDPAIVLDDADPARVAEGLFWGAFANNGQVCMAIKRAYVHESVYDEVVDALADQARAVQVGDGTEPGVRLGPINNEPQFARVGELVEEAVSSGARVAAGGAAIDRPGYFFAPTILADVADGIRIVDEEQFGPALPVIRYSDVDDAIDRANATHFGLGASVWTSDIDRGAEVAARIESGTAWVNSHLQIGPSQPFGGHKWSGIGVESGPWGLLGYTQLQVVHVTR